MEKGRIILLLANLISTFGYICIVLFFFELYLYIPSEPKSLLIGLGIVVGSCWLSYFFIYNGGSKGWVIPFIIMGALLMFIPITIFYIGVLIPIALMFLIPPGLYFWGSYIVMREKSEITNES